MAGQPTGALFASRPQVPLRRIPDCVGLGPFQYSQATALNIIARPPLYASRPQVQMRRQDLLPGRAYGIPTPTPPSTMMPATSWFMQQPLRYNFAAMRSQDYQGVNSGILQFAASIKALPEVAAAVETIAVAGAFLATMSEVAAAADTMTGAAGIASSILETNAATDIIVSTYGTSGAIVETGAAVDTQVGARGSTMTITDVSASALDTQTSLAGFTPAITDNTASAVDTSNGQRTVPLVEAASAVDTNTPTTQFAVAIADASAAAAEVISPSVAYVRAMVETGAAVDIATVSKGGVQTVVDTLAATEIVTGIAVPRGFIYENAFAWEPPNRPIFTVILAGTTPMQTMILSKRTFDSRPYDIVCTNLLTPGATIVSVNAVLVDQGGLTFGTPVINTQQNIYPDGTVAAIGSVIQIPISGGTIPPLLSQLMCTIRAQFTDSNGAQIEATVLLLLINEVIA